MQRVGEHPVVGGGERAEVPHPEDFVRQLAAVGAHPDAELVLQGAEEGPGGLVRRPERRDGVRRRLRELFKRQIRDAGAEIRGEGRDLGHLAGGLGLNIYGKDVLDDGRTELVLRAGGGVMWHFSDVWAVRGDFRLLLDTDNTEFNNEIDVGIVWNWDAGAQPEFVAVAGPVDTDGDGLTDDYEMQIGTDPNNPDTDGDGLTDGAEVLKYKTDPLNPDSDFDGLKDGAEVFKYKTDPLDPDTDKGGVTDGHEVLVDKTDPLNGNDDLLRFELHLLFDYDKADIKAKDYPDLDTVAKVLARNPGATATIEGHADRKFASKAEYNRRLSERRATAVKNYFIHKGIDASRLRAVGYGFERPKVKPDLKNGTPENRRVEVYIRGADERGISDALKAK